MLLPPEEALDDPVLERLEADDGDPPSGTKRLERRREGGLERFELVVDGDAQRLEDPPRRMTLGIAALIVSTSSPVRSKGCSRLRRTIALAIWRAYRYSP